MHIEAPGAPTAVPVTVVVIATGLSATLSEHLFGVLDIWGVLSELLEGYLQGATGDLEFRGEIGLYAKVVFVPTLVIQVVRELVVWVWLALLRGRYAV